MEQVLNLLIILENPLPGVEYGFQKGSGTVYETVQKQVSTGESLIFSFWVTVKGNRTGPPNFLGPFTQGAPDSRFVYIDIGKSAGYPDSVWSRRLKVPLVGIGWEMIDKILSGASLGLETIVPGIGRDGDPNCGTVKPFRGWSLTKC